MIKKSGALLLIMLYLITVTGFALNLHYCLSNIYSVKIDAPAKNCGIMASCKMKCCHDKRFEIKVKDAHQSGSTPFSSRLFNLTTPSLPFAYISLSAKQFIVENKINKDPPEPPVDNIFTFLKNCNFRI